MVFVGSHGGLLEFVAGLVEQFLGMRRVSIHVPLIELLGSLDLFEGLVAKALRRSQVWMSFPTDVFGRWLHSTTLPSLRVQQTPEKQTNTQHTS
jgi:hypothetical protein